MKPILKRLESLEADLTPQRFMLKFLDRMATFPNLDACALWIYSEECLAWCRTHRDAMTETIARSHRGRPASEHRKASLKAHREFHYLYALALWPCQKLEADHYRYLYHQSALIHLTLALSRREDLTGEEGLPKPWKTKLGQFKVGYERLVAELQADVLTESALSQRYFGGKPLFFPEQKAFLEERLDLLERLRGFHCDTLEELKWRFGEVDSHSAREALAFIESMTPDRDMAEKVAEFLRERQISNADRDALMGVYDSEERHLDSIRVFKARL